MLHQQVMGLASLYNRRRLDKGSNKRNNTNTSLEIVKNQIKEKEEFIKNLIA